MSLFIEDDPEDEESSYLNHTKKRRLNWDILSDLDLSDWEEIPLKPIETIPSLAFETPSEAIEALPEDLVVIISPPSTAPSSERIKQIIQDRKRRKSLLYLGITTYTTHAKQRNSWLSEKKVMKAAKKLLPKSLLEHVKKYRRSLAEKSLDLDVQLIYILRYLIKWFRLNFKFDSNGIRNLGYLPEHAKPEEYFPNKGPSISSPSSFIKMLKRFKHNRDTAAQVFTCLLRSLGLEARLVFSLPVLPKTRVLQPLVDHKKLNSNKDNDLLYPYFWTELVNPSDPSEIIVLEACCFHDDTKRITRLSRYNGDISNSYTSIFYPEQNQYNQMNMQYVIALDNDNLILDVTSRYRKDVAFRWFGKLDLCTDDGRSCLLFQSLLRYFNSQLEYAISTNKELSALRKLALSNYTTPTTFSALKRNPNIVTPSTLRLSEVIPVNAPILKYINLNSKRIPLYFRNEVVVGKSENQWKFLGRSVKPNELPIKKARVIPRTIYNRRVYNNNVANDQAELNQVELYSFAQTCPYICLEVVDDILPRNKYGNIEVFHPCMVPKGCTWLKLTHIEEILTKHKTRRLNIPNGEAIQFVPVVVGFKFSANNAIPMKGGVIVLNQQEILAKKVWLYGRIQMDKKDPMIALRAWDGFLRRLRIKNHLEKEYGT